MVEAQGAGKRLCLGMSVLSLGECSKPGFHDAHQQQRPSLMVWKAETEGCKGPDTYSLLENSEKAGGYFGGTYFLETRQAGAPRENKYEFILYAKSIMDRRI